MDRLRLDRLQHKMLDCQRIGMPVAAVEDIFELIDAVLSIATPAAEPAAPPAGADDGAYNWPAAHDAWWRAANVKYRDNHAVAFEAGYRAGWHAALAAPAPQVTAEMVEAMCEYRFGPELWAHRVATAPLDAERTRRSARGEFTAALAARKAGGA